MTYISDALVKVRGEGFLDYRTRELPTWCPGCGYFGIAHALLQVVGELGLRNEEMCVVSGIGCAGRFPIFMKVYGFHTLHGRAVPIASGVKLASPELTVFAIGGDGDIMGIGGGGIFPISPEKTSTLPFFFSITPSMASPKGSLLPPPPWERSHHPTPGATLTPP